MDNLFSSYRPNLIPSVLFVHHPFIGAQCISNELRVSPGFRLLLQLFHALESFRGELELDALRFAPALVFGHAREHWSVPLLLKPSLIGGHGGGDTTTTVAAVASNVARTIGCHTSTVSESWAARPVRQGSELLIYHPH